MGLYKEQDENRRVIGEPAIEYSSVRENGEYLPDVILVGAIKYAHMARDKRRMISNEDVYGVLGLNFNFHEHTYNRNPRLCGFQPCCCFKGAS